MPKAITMSLFYYRAKVLLDAGERRVKISEGTDLSSSSQTQNMSANLWSGWRGCAFDFTKHAKTGKPPLLLHPSHYGSQIDIFSCFFTFYFKSWKICTTMKRSDPYTCRVTNRKFEQNIRVNQSNFLGTGSKTITFYPQQRKWLDRFSSLAKRKRIQ